MTLAGMENAGTDWLTFAVPLVAVIIGGAVTFGGQYLLNRRREKGEAKAGARVIQLDLAAAASRLKDMASGDRQWYGFYDVALPNWTDRQGVLALHLSTKSWESVSQSALELRAFNDGMRQTFTRHGPNTHEGTLYLTDKQQDAVRTMWENATGAYNVLAPLAHTDAEQDLLHEREPPVGGGAS